MKRAELADFVQLLFRDVPLSLLAQAGAGQNEFPWSNFQRAYQTADDNPKLACEQLAEIVERTNSTRQRLWASSCLNEFGISSSSDWVEGIVVEVLASSSADTFAFYRDGTLRFINKEGQVMIYDDHDPLMQKFSSVVLDMAKPLLKRSPNFPEPCDGITLTILTLGESQVVWSPLNGYHADPIFSEVFFAATKLLSALSHVSHQVIQQ